MALKIHLAVLAAGLSNRFGGEDKLAAPLRGTTILQQTLAVFDNEAFTKVSCIYSADAIEPLIPPHWCRIKNQNPANGLSGSLRLAVNHNKACDWLMVALGDMPFVSPMTIAKLINRAQHLPSPAPSYWAIAPADSKARVGHPVLWHRSAFSALNEISGDKGGKALLPGKVEKLMLKDPGIFKDIDTREDLTRFKDD